MLGAMAERSEPTVKKAMHIRKMRLAPKISPAFPANGMMAVAASWLTLKIHPARINEALKSVVMTGNATDTDVPLMETNRNDRLPTAKTIYRDIVNSVA